MEWQPIATAPKDGTWLLLWDAEDEHPHVGAFVEFSTEELAPKDWGGLYLTGNGWLQRMAPTHWMPLPEPPK